MKQIADSRVQQAFIEAKNRAAADLQRKMDDLRIGPTADTAKLYIEAKRLLHDLQELLE